VTTTGSTGVHDWTRTCNSTRETVDRSPAEHGSSRLTRKRSLVQTQYRPPVKLQVKGVDCDNLTTRHRPKRLSARSPTVRVIQAQATQGSDVCSSTWTALLTMGAVRGSVWTVAPTPNPSPESHPKRGRAAVGGALCTRKTTIAAFCTFGEVALTYCSSQPTSRGNDAAHDVRRLRSACLQRSDLLPDVWAPDEGP